MFARSMYWRRRYGPILAGAAFLSASAAASWPGPAAAGAKRAGNIAAMPISRLGEPWWRERFEAKQRELRNRPVDLVWLGDSITQDWELDGPQAWKLFAPVWDRFYGDRHTINLGFKGDSTCHLLWRIRHGELDGIRPKAVVVLIGANNFGHVHTDAEQTFAGIEAVLDEVHRRLPGTRVLLLSVLPSMRSEWVSRNTRRLNEELKRSVAVDRSYLTFLDVGYLLIDDGKPDPARFLDSHLSPPEVPLHPTAQVQARIAAAIEPTLHQMLGDQAHR